MLTTIDEKLNFLGIKEASHAEAECNKRDESSAAVISLNARLNAVFTSEAT